jgi:hypothetical protein
MPDNTYTPKSIEDAQTTIREMERTIAQLDSISSKGNTDAERESIRKVGGYQGCLDMRQYCYGWIQAQEIEAMDPKPRERR